MPKYNFIKQNIDKKESNVLLNVECSSSRSFGSTSAKFSKEKLSLSGTKATLRTKTKSPI